MKDERLYALSSDSMQRVDESFFPYFCETYPSRIAYLVSWPYGEMTVAKAGFTRSPRRWRVFVARGATVDALFYGSAAASVENALLDWLSSEGDHAFQSKEQAAPHLGSKGGGWLECYALPTERYERLLTEVNA